MAAVATKHFSGQNPWAVGGGGFQEDLTKKVRLEPW